MVRKGLALVYVAIVCGQPITNNQENFGLTQNRYPYRNRRIYRSVSSDSINWSGVTNSSEMRERNGEALHKGNQRGQIWNESKKQMDGLNFNVNEREDKELKAFDNLIYKHHSYTEKYNERLKSSSQADIIVFYANIICNRISVTKNWRPENNSANNFGPRRDFGIMPETDLSNWPDENPQKNSNSNTSNGRDHNISNNNTVDEIFNLSKTEDTVTEIPDLKNRVNFEGDPCPTGFVKVNGKCVEEQK